MGIHDTLDTLLDEAMEAGDQKLCWYVALLIDRQNRQSETLPDGKVEEAFANSTIQ